MMRILLLLLCLTVSLKGTAAEYPDPGRFEKAIAAFEAEEADSPPQPGSILCIGSSSIRYWHPKMDEDLAPLPLVKRGFGGSNMNDVVHFYDRIVTARPKAVLLYQGDNDTALGIPPGQFMERFQTFRKRLHVDYPECHLFVLSIKPSPKRWNIWADAVAANELLKQECEADPLLTYVDVASPMFTSDGELRPELFIEDRLHMNREGYKIWRKVLRAALLPDTVD